MAKAMRYFVAKVERETEKAILAEYIYHVDTLTMEEYTAKVWLPKSQIEVYADLGNCTAYKVPLWLCNKNHLPTNLKKHVDEILARL